MTSLKQIEANRRNALNSTGPRTEQGKQTASRNAVRHGLTAETVIEPLEDREDYEAFEQAVAADYEPQSAVERELILRLASLLWRLRRATSIETGLMSIENDRKGARGRHIQPKSPAAPGLFRLRKRGSGEQIGDAWNGRSESTHAFPNDQGIGSGGNLDSTMSVVQAKITQRFLHVANLDNGIFERLSRYEMMLWRQVRQTIFTLEIMRRPRLAAHRPRQLYWPRTSDGEI